MAKINLGNVDKNSRNDMEQSNGSRLLTLISTGLLDVQILADVFNTVNSAVDSKKTADIDNKLKLSQAVIEAQKEQNRHEEEMAKIQCEWKKISDAATDRGRRLSFIQDQIEKFEAEYNKYLSLEKEEFMNDTVTSRLESLRKVIVELTRELNRE